MGGGGGYYNKLNLNTLRYSLLADNQHVLINSGFIFSLASPKATKLQEDIVIIMIYIKHRARLHKEVPIDVG